MLIGYARVSTTDQNLDHQVDALLRAGVEPGNIYKDYASGAKASRPEWDRVLDKLRADDVLVVTRLDRMGRSLQHLVNLAARLRDEKVGFKVLEQNIDTSTAEGRMMFGVMCTLAEYQRELILANTRDGLIAARNRGHIGGRKPVLNEQQAARAQELYDRKTLTVQEIGNLLKIPRSTVYGYLNQEKKKKKVKT